MEETYEDIVRKWYMKLRGNFTNLLMDKYRSTNMRLADAENIYQDIFVAIQRNLDEGRIKKNTDWQRYIITIGLNMAGKHYRHHGKMESVDDTATEDDSRSLARARRVSDLLKDLPVQDGETVIYKDSEAQTLLSDELTHTPEPCASIIRMTYYSDMTDAEIASELDPYRNNGKSTRDNAKAVKARRWLCMQDLIYRVKIALYNAGIIDQKPVRRKRNGK
ncbi:MAG: hypothetical protein K2N05_03880 [Muribaculaceae bacterium]|nr:hypothetical protein [Muribaculaceae bacterium]